MKQTIFLMLFLAFALTGFAKTDLKRVQLDSTLASQVGVRELTGQNDGVEVEMYLASVQLSEGYPWCGAFMAWGYDQQSLRRPKSGAWAPAWFPTSKLIYKKGKSLNGKPPQQSDVMGIYFASKKRIAHVGHIHRWPPDQDYAITIEGNTNGAGSREGDGVYKKRRLKRHLYVADWIS